MTDLIRRADLDDTTTRLEAGLLGVLVTTFAVVSVTIASMRLDEALVQMAQAAL